MAPKRNFFRSEEKKGNFNIACWSDENWSTSEYRFLTVFQHVPTEDIKAGYFLSTKELKYTYEQFMKQARALARTYQDIPNFAYAVINFNEASVKGLTDDKLAEKNAEFTVRAVALIKKLKPTHVLISSVSAFRYIMKEFFPEEKNIDYKRGWVFEKDEVKFVGTLDLFRALLSDESANCVGFGFQHAANLMIGYNPYNLSKVVPSYKEIKTLKEFDEFIAKLSKAKYVGFDTETRSLKVNGNAIYTAQFTLDSEPTVGYVLVIDHPTSHWSKEDRVYIKKALRRFFYQKGRPFLITYNGMFDLRIVRQCLKLPIINRDCWELMAGEHDLDENVNKLTSIYGVPQGNLRACLCRYNNDFYFKNAFTKEDRNTIGNIDIEGHDVLMYCAADAVFALNIFKMQLRRAKDFLIAGKTSYKPLFINHMLGVMSPTAHALSHLRQDGSYIDMDYMHTLSNPATSPLGERLKEIEKEIYAQKEVQAANNLLCEREGFKATSLFGSSAPSKWMLSLSKPDHRAALFFDIMHLKPVSYTKAGSPAVDDDFKEAYKYSNAIVSLYADYTDTNKLLNTYVKSWNRILTLTDSDSIHDRRLRPDYAFYNVLTGRLGSRNPSLQVIPQHSDIAKYIKRAFIAPPGCMLIHYDYNAQEVRTWGIVAHDDKIADTFRIGQRLRQQYIQNPTKENKDLIKKKGDVHCLNVKTFFGKEVDKKDPLRVMVKGVVFSTIYMMSPKSMGESIKGADILAAKEAIHESWLKSQDNSLSISERRQATQEFKKASQRLKDIIEEDRTQLALDTMNKVFANFKNGKKWIDETVAMGEAYGHTISPVGRIRHVPSILLTQGNTKARAVRQSCNAPIQGFASEIAVVASRLASQLFYSHFKAISSILGCNSSMMEDRIQVLRIIHDANYAAIPYEMVIPYLHIMQYAATYGTAQYFKEKFNFQFNIEPEIEMEISTCDSDPDSTWDWSVDNLIKIIDHNLKEGYKQGYVQDDPEEAIEQVLAAYRNKKCVHYLEEHFPLLGVKGLEANIEAAIKRYDESKNS